MKKLIGISITLLSALASMILWNVFSLSFELEGTARDKLGLGVNFAVLLPLAAYLASALHTHFCYKKRLDSNGYQPLARKPVALCVNAVLQIAAMALIGFPTQSHGQSAAAFTAAVCFVVLTGLLSLSAALILGRPVGGRTYLPFVHRHLYQ